MLKKEYTNGPRGNWNVKFLWYQNPDDSVRLRFELLDATHTENYATRAEAQKRWDEMKRKYPYLKPTR